MKKAVIVHQWEGSPGSDWYPWAKRELEKLGYQVLVPKMPTPNAPEIKSWVRKLREEVDEPGEALLLIGHSVGGQVILRYLEALPDNKKVGKAVIVAPWFRLTATAAVTEEEKEVARPWLRTTIDFEKVKLHCSQFVAIFSDDDYFVPLEFNKKVCVEKLNAEIIVEHNLGHFSGGDGVTKLTKLLKFI